MFRVFVRSGRQINSLTKSTFIQSKKAFSNKDINDNNTDDTNRPKFMAKVKDKLKNVAEKLQEWDEAQKQEDIEIPTMRPDIPRECDIIVIGGGAMGSSVAYWLKQRVHKSLKVVVIERDPTYRTASTALSVGGMRQQFSLKENIQMSLFGAEFIRNINKHLDIKDEPAVDAGFHPYGYLMLASAAGAETLHNNSTLQNSLGAKNILLSPDKLAAMFPWLNTEGIELGCLGLEKEGWFDPWSLLCAFKKKAQYLGARFIHAEATGFVFKEMDYVTDTGVSHSGVHKKLDELIIKTPDGETHNIRFTGVVVAAGAFSGEVAKMAEIGERDGVLSVPLPVEPRKRFVYCFHCPDGPGLNTPLTIDPTGTYFRRDGLAGTYISGRSPSADSEPSIEDLNVDDDYFNEKVWPVLANRVKGFENIKVKCSWAGYYEYNTYDKNGIIGRHPYHSNCFFATGFSGHGIQQSPAVGRAITELILDNKFMTIDLENLGFDRFLSETPMLEANVF